MEAITLTTTIGLSVKQRRLGKNVIINIDNGIIIITGLISPVEL